MILLNIFLLLVIIVAIVLILMFFIAFKINFVFDSDRDNINLTILWLYPLIKAEIHMKDAKPMLKVFLLKMKIYENALKLKPKKGLSNKMTLVKDIKFDDISLTAYYGFKDKFTVGIVCGLINYAMQFLHFKNLKSIEQTPDFLADNDYILINANATMKIGPNLLSLANH